MTEEIRQLRFVAPPRACRVLLLRHGETTPVSDGVAVPMLEGQSNHSFAERVREGVAPDNWSISEIVVTTEGWVPRRFNDVAHLDGR